MLLLKGKQATDSSQSYVTSPPVLSCDTSVSNKSSHQIEIESLLWSLLMLLHLRMAFAYF